MAANPLRVRRRASCFPTQFPRKNAPHHEERWRAQALRYALVTAALTVNARFKC